MRSPLLRELGVCREAFLEQGPELGERGLLGRSLRQGCGWVLAWLLDDRVT